MKHEDNIDTVLVFRLVPIKGTKGSSNFSTFVAT